MINYNHRVKGVCSPDLKAVMKISPETKVVLRDLIRLNESEGKMDVEDYKRVCTSSAVVSLLFANKFILYQDDDIYLTVEGFKFLVYMGAVEKNDPPHYLAATKDDEWIILKCNNRTQ